MTPDWKFSIVIPVYNRAQRIGDAIRSVLAQTYSNFEIIVVDDGSTDDTANAIKQFTDPRVIYIHQENKERGAARNTGKKAATGDYITFLDSDDEFLPNHLETISRFIQTHSGYDIFCSSYKMIGSHKTMTVKMPKDIRGQLIKGNFLSCNGVFLPKKISDEYNFSEERSMSGLEDWELWLRIASKKSMIGSPAFTTVMHQHDERSVLQTKKESMEDRFETFQKHVLLNAEVMHFYKRKIRTFKSSCETYMALHLALTKTYKRAAFNHLLKGFMILPSIIFTKRFYAILKRIP